MSPAPSVLVLTRFFLPGYKGGGPIQSIANLAAQLRGQIVFNVVCLGYDAGDSTHYEGVPLNEWTKINDINVIYAKSPTDACRIAFRELRNKQHRTIYLNSFFDPVFSLLPTLIQWSKLSKIDRLIIAPRGELSPGALGISRTKKRIVLMASSLLKLHRNAILHATSELEEQEVKSLAQLSFLNVFRAANLPRAHRGIRSEEYHFSESSVRIAFLSRIARKKNLKFAIEVARQCKCNIQFDIFGPIEDKEYWNECLDAMSERLPGKEIQYCGEIHPDRSIDTLKTYDIFLLPTLGENYCHAAVEALAAGCSLLLSDLTPWTDLRSKGLGADIPLSEPVEFSRFIEDFSKLSPDSRKEARNLAIQFSTSLSANPELCRKYFEMLIDPIQSNSNSNFSTNP